MTSSTEASRPEIEIAEKSDPGRDPTKQVNEDACAHRETRLGHLLVVCDGMGGHQAGREASNLAVQTIIAMVEGAPEGLSPAQVLKGAIEQAGRAVFQLGGPASNFARPGSTVVALLVHPGGTEIAHVGDSRAYCIRGGQIYPLTRDHSMVQQMVEAGFLHPDEAYGHPDANKITRALGLRAETDVELRPAPMPQEKGDIFLLGTDGLFDVARPEEVLEVVLASSDLPDACEKLVDLANARGGPDNITVQLARVVEAGLRTPLPTAASFSPGTTQLADAPLAEPRATVIADIPSSRARGAGMATLKETLPLGSMTHHDLGLATLADEAAPITERAPSPIPVEASIAGEPAQPSQRGGLYLALGIGAVWLIIAAVSFWWLVRRGDVPAEAEAPQAAPEPIVSAAPEPPPPPEPPPESPSAPSAEPPEMRRPRRHPWFLQPVSTTHPSPLAPPPSGPEDP